MQLFQDFKATALKKESHQKNSLCTKLQITQPNKNKKKLDEKKRSVVERLDIIRPSGSSRINKGHCNIAGAAGCG